MAPTAKADPRAVPRNGIKRAVRTDTNIVKNSCNMQLVLPVKKGKAPTELSSGRTGFSPDGKTFLAICENTPQIHFGSQCATERLYRHLPAKVELKKSHFGKQSLIECALRHLPCQSELAELRERNKKHRAELGPVRFYKLVFTKEY